MRLFKQSLTDENDDFDGLFAALLFAIVFGIGVSAWDYFKRGNDFDFEKFGTGIAMIAGAGGAGYGAKRLGEKYGNRDTGSSSS